MELRAIHWDVSFRNAVRLGDNLLPPGTYEICAEVAGALAPKEVCWQRIQFYITIRRERRPIDLRALDDALRRDRALGATASATLVPDACDPITHARPLRTIAACGPERERTRDRRTSMAQRIVRSTAVFLRPFHLPGYDAELPAGRYQLDTEIRPPAGMTDPAAWRASVVIHLHPTTEMPNLARALTVRLADIDAAIARDEASGQSLDRFFLQAMLDDPMIRMVMESDGVTEADLRRLYEP
ncbi:hypothetical protein EBL87_13225 [Cereibacter sphaeroides]|uniref:hypothetical protein n=1 Tax=Cereibacter sphaeroides TaxID=1063 RepID=UPI000F51B20E|nr:hypothetical protein [Cereibacter sphaeroides]AZB65267.1 hypothetical protein EBL87_13225 [Cereibacter sphaeroides]AZB67412.1 hypothetical protein EBL86_02950 [Cereibacter sphaeroides]